MTSGVDTAASLLVRRLDPITVQAILGHTSIKTTERYMHPRRAAELADDVTPALNPVSATPDRDEIHGDRDLRAAILDLPPNRRQRLLTAATNP